jgi:hypothetical protein
MGYDKISMMCKKTTCIIRYNDLSHGQMHNGSATLFYIFGFIDIIKAEILVLKHD